MFTDKIEVIIYNVVANIGWKDIIPKEIGTVSWSWNDDDGKLHTKKLNNVLFPDSPVNIPSSTVMAESMKDDKGTWFLTKIKYSIFTLIFWKYTKTIAH